MNEEEFGKRFKRAIGDTPPLDVPAALGAINRDRHRPPIGALGPIAATLALLVIASIAGWRLASQSTIPSTTVKLPPPSPLPTAGAVDPLSCRLPVVIDEESGPPGMLTSQPGFFDTRSGQYRVDSSASIAGLPGGVFEGTDVKPARPAAAVWYDEALGRWLPVGPASVAPDGRSYAWIRLLPPGSNFANLKSSELHRFDLVTGTDHALWTYDGQLMVVRWAPAGILVEGDPPGGGQLVDWLIDPATGAASQQPWQNPVQQLTRLPSEQGGAFSFGSFGQDSQGRTLYRIGSRQPADQEWIFYESTPGARVTIYKGTQGDATGFDPARALGDNTGIWFSDYEMHGVWHWDVKSGLRKIVAKGLPPMLNGANSQIYVDPAGPCM